MIFISHKTEDKHIANEVLSRAIQRKYSEKQIFLDSDPGSGIETGAAWECNIYASLKRSRAMIVLCSPNWLTSQWCFVELGYAKAMAISVFPIVIEKCDVGSTLNSTQAIDLTTAEDATARNVAFERLWRALEEQHLGPKDNLPWPPPGEPDNCPFPGLMYFDERQAPVFFGREQERDTVILRLKAMRNSGIPRLLMIGGGSGSGKSSLLRAGVLAWLRHPTEQQDWFVLPTLRYGETPNDDVTLLARLAEIITDGFPKGAPSRPGWKELRDKFESDNVEHATRDFVEVALELCRAQRDDEKPFAPTNDKGSTMLLAIDQFEELLTAAARPSAMKFLQFLRVLLSRSNGRLLVIGTLRSDYIEVYENHSESLKPPFLTHYRLPPFPWERVTEVIVKPAERVDVTFSDELVNRLKTDAPNSDALPLLAFTLENLYRRYASDGTLELQEYLDLGGMEGAIQKSIDHIIPPGSLASEITAALRLSFVKHLAQATDKDEEYVRLTARWTDLPVAAKPVLEKFIKERLLVTSGRDGQIQVEVAHESMFRCWNDLKDWLRTSADILRWRRDVRRDQASDKKWTSLRPAQLEMAREWPRQRREELTDAEIIWIQQSIRRRWYRRSAIAAVCLVISVLAVIARREQVTATARYDQVIRLSDIKRLADLQIESEQLWPATPPMIPNFAKWLTSVESLRNNIAIHRKTLQLISASPKDSATNWERYKLQELTNALDVFFDPDPLIGTVASVKARADFAAEVEIKTLIDEAAIWKRAIASIANKSECPNYQGIKIHPQIGLVPIGRDPESGLWEFWHVQTGTRPARTKTGRLAVQADMGLVFVLIPGGQFTMGTEIQFGGHDDERPAKRLTLSPFFLSKYEMTQYQWKIVFGKNPSSIQSDDHPVEQVSWHDCKRAMDRLGLLLPTEAQWEYAARAGTTTLWWSGDSQESLKGCANLADSFAAANGLVQKFGYEDWLNDNSVYHAPVGSYRANPFGLFDVAGNLWEWCADCYDPRGYEVTPNNGDGLRVVTSESRVNRGGSYYNGADPARSGFRYGDSPNAAFDMQGVRPACTVKVEIR